MTITEILLKVVFNITTITPTLCISKCISRLWGDVLDADLGSITFKCNRLHYNYFAITITSIFKCN
jgi:hypothetical protein